MHDSAHDIDEFDEELKSKSEIKREMHELQDYGRRLVGLSKHQRSKLPLTEDIKDALVLADKIKNKHEAFKRHIQYIGKVLRETDLEPINHALDIMANKHQQESMKFVYFETLRDELIDQGSDKIEALLAEHELLERQKLRQLVRQASKEKAAEKTGKSYRDLFTYLRENITL